MLQLKSSKLPQFTVHKYIIHTCIHTYIRVCMHSHTYIHSFIHTYMHTYIHTWQFQEMSQSKRLANSLTFVKLRFWTADCFYLAERCERRARGPDYFQLQCDVCSQTERKRLNKLGRSHPTETRVTACARRARKTCVDAAKPSEALRYRRMFFFFLVTILNITGQDMIKCLIWNLPVSLPFRCQKREQQGESPEAFVQQCMVLL